MRADTGHAIYDDIAASYDSIYNDRLALAENDALRTYLAPHVDAADSVIDLGCGTGLFLDLFPGPIWTETHNYTGVDISHGMLARAREKHPQANLVHGDMLDPLIGGPFDLVVSLFSGNFVGLTALAQQVARLIEQRGMFFGVFLTEPGARAQVARGQPSVPGYTACMLSQVYQEHAQFVTAWYFEAYGERLRQWPLNSLWLPLYLRLEHLLPGSKQAAHYVIVTATNVQ